MSARSGLVAAAKVVGVVGGVAAVGRGTQVLAVRRWAKRPTIVEQADYTLAGVEHRVVSSDGSEVFAIEAGAGPTVVLGHGIAGDHTHWAPVANRLVERGFRVVAFDQRGHGRSTVGSDGYTLAGLGHDVAAVVTALGGDGKVVLCGHSMGGVGIQAMVTDYPEVIDRVAGVALVSTLSQSSYRKIADWLLTPQVWGPARRLLDNDTTGRVVMRLGFGKDFDLEMVDHLLKTWRAMPAETFLGLGHGLAEFDHGERLGRIDPPTAVLCGSLDRTTPPALSRALDERLPNSHLKFFPRAGHMLVWEQVDALVDKIAALATPS